MAFRLIPKYSLENYAHLHIDNLELKTLWQTLCNLMPNLLLRGNSTAHCEPFTLPSIGILAKIIPLAIILLNLLIHILTAVFLFKATLFFLNTLSLKKYQRDDALFIALLTTALLGYQSDPDSGSYLYRSAHGVDGSHVFYLCHL